MQRTDLELIRGRRDEGSTLISKGEVEARVGSGWNREERWRERKKKEKIKIERG